MKKPPSLLIVIGLLTAGAIIYVTTHYVSSHYLSTRPKVSIAKCPDQQTLHVVIIQNNTVTPAHTEASLCDSLIIINNDNRLRELAFGQHDHHEWYNGVSETFIGQNHSLTITLNQTGTYTFHDHLEDKLLGSFTVHY